MNFKLCMAAAILGAAFAGCQKQPAAAPAAPPPPAVTVTQPISKDVVEWDEYQGWIEAVDTVEIRARVNGYLDSINFKDGAEVEEGRLAFCD